MGGNKFRALAVILFIAAGSVFLASCQLVFDIDVPPSEVCPKIEEAPFAELTSEEQIVEFENPDSLIVYRGTACAESDESGRENILKVEQSIQLPTYVNDATVVLSGWKVNYLSGDHHVVGFGTVIGNIKLENAKLSWQAAGVLSDNEFKEGYGWCYNYTAIGWNRGNLNLVSDNSDACFTRGGNENYYFATNAGQYTALSSFSSFIQNAMFTQSRTVAIVPRGYGFAFNKDRHLLQAAYNHDHSEKFAEFGKGYKKGAEEVNATLSNPASESDSEFVSWETYFILKDNEGRRPTGFSEIVSGLAGNDIEIIQPPFSILPFEDEDNHKCNPIEGTFNEEFTVEKIPQRFDYAIPVLTGWDIGYCRDDEEITKMGVRIEDFNYEKTPGSTGRLTYKLASDWEDGDGEPGHYTRHNVMILGFLRVLNVTDRFSPDLVPFSPSGAEPSAFCRFEEDGKLLRVSVKNQGNVDAGDSKTSVVFGDAAVTLETPPIAKGAAVDLLFKVPNNCFVPDCSFKITVDSGGQVDEVNFEGNNSIGGGCLG